MAKASATVGDVASIYSILFHADERRRNMNSLATFFLTMDSLATVRAAATEANVLYWSKQKVMPSRQSNNQGGHSHNAICVKKLNLSVHRYLTFLIVYCILAVVPQHANVRLEFSFSPARTQVAASALCQTKPSQPLQAALTSC